MPDLPTAPDAAPSSGSVDGLSATPPAPAAPPADAVARAKKKVLSLVTVLYGAYILWAGFLLIALPSPTGEGQGLVAAGILSSLLAIVASLLTGAFVLRRISRAQTSIATRRQGLIKVVAALIPIVAVAAAVPPLIIREPRLPLDIVSPADPNELIAPVSVTMSAERAADILRKRGLRVLKFQWDTDGDGKLNDETIVPTTTVVFERQGLYNAVVRIYVEGSEARRVTKRVVIPYAVFSVVPVQPVVERDVKFSVSNLLPDPKQLKEVEWDFGDGNPPEKTKTPDIVHTFYSVGQYPVSAVVQMQNQSQTTYKKTVAVTEPPQLPFPITLSATPQKLLGPAPFGVVFRLDTKEPLREIAWNFGDGKEDRGTDLIRQSHSFDAPGIYPVVVRARSAAGKLAELTTIVRVTEALILRDLTFEGKPAVLNGRVSGEVPLEFSLTPKTTTPLVQFAWELPEDAVLQVTGKTLSGVLRKEGTYTIMLMAQGAEDKSMRMPLTIDVKPPSAEPSIVVKPDGGVAPLSVVFDASQTFIPPGESIAGFKWLFGDEKQGDRTAEVGAARVQHTYTAPGEYTARLAVVLVSGKEYTAQRTIIVRRPALSACITASRLRVDAGKGIQFDSACSTGITTNILWDVRLDSQPGVIQAQSSEPAYVYVFEQPGTYTVTLTLKDQYGNQNKTSLSIQVAGLDEPPPEEPSPEEPPSEILPPEELAQ